MATQTDPAAANPTDPGGDPHTDPVAAASPWIRLPPPPFLPTPIREGARRVAEEHGGGRVGTEAVGGGSRRGAEAIATMTRAERVFANA